MRKSETRGRLHGDERIGERREESVYNAGIAETGYGTSERAVVNVDVMNLRFTRKVENQCCAGSRRSEGA